MALPVEDSLLLPGIEDGVPPAHNRRCRPQARLKIASPLQMHPATIGDVLPLPRIEDGLPPTPTIEDGLRL